MKLKLLFAWVLTCVAFYSNAQNKWDGDNPIGNFTYGSNYFGNPSDGDVLTWNSNTDFTFNYINSSQTSLYWDLPWKPVKIIYYDGTFNKSMDWNGNGNGIDLYYKLENYSSYLQNVNIPLSAKGAVLELNPINGNLAFNNIIYGNGIPINIYGAQQVTFSGDISGNQGVTINSTNTVVYSGVSKTYSGTTTLNSGTLRISSNQTLTNLDLKGGTLVIDPNFTLTLTGTYSAATGTTINNSGTIKFAGGSVTFPGSATVNNGTVSTLTNIEAGSSAILNIDKSIEVAGSITVSGNAIFDTSNHQVGGTGTKLIMTGTSTYKTKGSGSKPDASGNYSLDPTTTIEFYGTSATDIRYGTPNYYANIIVNGSNVSNAGTANGIRFQTGETFVVKNGATFSINTAAGFTGGVNTGINTITNGGPTITLEAGSTIEYSGANQTITPFPAYYNLTISETPSKPGIKTTTATTINIGNDLNIKSSQLTVNDGQAFVVTNKVNNTGGNFTIENNGRLIQTNDVANSGNLNYKRANSTTLELDYTFWSSPVANQNLLAVSPTTKLDKFFSFDSSTENWVQVDPSTTTMTLGKGYIIRGILQPSSPPPGFYTAIFTGVPNNGNISIAVTGSEKSNLVGNPYPSAIDANEFLLQNKNVIYGTLYFWTHNTPRDSNGQYNANDYASYNFTGGVGLGVTLDPYNPIASTIPTGKIGAGQSFFVTSLAASGNIIFNNSMRLISNLPIDNSQFFKTKNPKAKLAIIEKNRIWLNLTNTEGAFKQTLLGYITGATNEYDNAFDGESYDGQEFVDFYSVNQDKNLVIQGRALPFDENDLVPLGFRSTIEGTFTIAIDQTDGFLSNQAVFLEDNLTNTIFDLKSGNYSFTSKSGTFNDRFVLRYTNKTLENTNFEAIENQVLVSSKNKQIKINSTVETIDKVLIYDLLGREIYQKNNVNTTELNILNLVSSKQVLIAKVTLKNGKEVSKKIIY